jgi:hypothetical protein
MQKKKLGDSKVKSKSSKDKANTAKDDDSSDSHTEKVGAAITEDDFSKRFVDSYISCADIEAKTPEEKCLVVWNDDTTRVSIDVIIAPMSADERAASVVTETPFYIDSCSPVHADFISLSPIEVHNVQGMNGTYIAAIGKGTVIMKCDKPHPRRGPLCSNCCDAPHIHRQTC